MLQKIKNITLNNWLQILFFGFSWLYLSIYCSETLRFVEQLRLFEYDSYYFAQTFRRPGGALEYADEFITQFFYVPWIGAFILSCIYLAVQWLLANISAFGNRFYALTFFPSALLLFLQTDTSSQVSFPLGVLLVLYSLYIGIKIIPEKFQLVGMIILILPTFLISTGYAFVFAAFVVLYALGQKQFKKAFMLFVISSAVLFLLNTAAYYFIFTSTSLKSILFANLPFIQHSFSNLNQWVVIVFILMGLMIFANKIPFAKITHFPAKKVRIISLSMLLLMCLGVSFFSFTNAEVRRTLRMDQAVVTENWSQVLQLAKGLESPTLLETYFTNIALCKSRKMDESLFQYKQAWNTEGLFLKFEGNSLNTFFGGEVYYQLGMINYAYRWAMEAMIMNNNKKSGRMLKRMIEISIINGEWKLAQKYISTLKKTLFHVKAARYYESLIVDQKKLTQNESLKSKFILLPKNNFLSGDDTNAVGFLSHYLALNSANKFVADYFMAATLLSLDFDNFMMGISNLYVSDGREIPRVYEEAIVFIASQTQNKLAGSYPFSNKLKADFLEFNKMVKSHGVSKISENLVFKEKFEHTYWYYVLLNYGKLKEAE
jgi:hypothetical protein